MKIFFIIGIAMLMLLAAPVVAQEAGSDDQLEVQATAALLNSSATRQQIAMEAALAVVSANSSLSDEQIARLRADLSIFENQSALLSLNISIDDLNRIRAALIAASEEFNSDLNLSRNDSELREEIREHIRERNAQMNQTLNQTNTSAWNIARRGLLIAFDNRVNALQKAIDRQGTGNATADLQAQLEEITAMRAELEASINAGDKNATRTTMQQIGDAIQQLKESLRSAQKSRIKEKVRGAKDRCLNTTNQTNSTACIKQMERLENETENETSNWSQKDNEVKKKSDEMRQQVQEKRAEHRQQIDEKIQEIKGRLSERREEIKKEYSDDNESENNQSNTSGRSGGRRGGNGGRNGSD